MKKLHLVLIIILVIFSCTKESSNSNDNGVKKFCWKCTTTPYTRVTKCGIVTSYSSHTKTIVHKCDYTEDQSAQFEISMTNSSSISVYTSDCASGGYVVTTNGQNTECVKE